MTPTGANLAASLRESTLFFLTQTESIFSVTGKIRTWIESQSRLEKKLMEYELKLRTLEAANARLAILEKENEDLKSSYASMNAAEWMGATLLSGGSKYLIDLGSTDGVLTGAVVLARGSFLGVIKETQTQLSQVTSIFDPEARFGVRIGPDGALGVLRVKHSTLIVTTISRAEGIKEGDRVVTLGDEQVRRGGLPVGTVTRILTRPADAVSTFEIRPDFEIEQIRAVIVSKEGP